MSAMFRFLEDVVFVFHNGSQRYFKNAIISIIKQGLKVVHVGSTDLVIKGMVTYKPPMSNFSSCYIHMSHNGYENELICFERWFAIRDVAVKLGIDKFWHLDSDVFLTDHWRLFSKEIENSNKVFLVTRDGENFSAHVSHWTFNELDSFCSFINDMYAPKVHNDLLVKWEHHKINNIAGGVCDMTLLKLWIRTKSESEISFLGKSYHVQDNLNIIIENKMYLEDLSISKNLVETVNGELVPFIHCQGRAKWLLRFRTYLSLRLSYLALKHLYFGIRILH